MAARAPTVEAERARARRRGVLGAAIRHVALERPRCCPAPSCPPPAIALAEAAIIVCAAEPLVATARRSAQHRSEVGPKATPAGPNPAGLPQQVGSLGAHESPELMLPMGSRPFGSRDLRCRGLGTTLDIATHRKRRDDSPQWCAASDQTELCQHYIKHANFGPTMCEALMCHQSLDPSCASPRGEASAGPISGLVFAFLSARPETNFSQRRPLSVCVCASCWPSLQKHRFSDPWMCSIQGLLSNTTRKRDRYVPSTKRCSTHRRQSPWHAWRLLQRFAKRPLPCPPAPIQSDTADTLASHALEGPRLGQRTRRRWAPCATITRRALPGPGRRRSPPGPGRAWCSPRGALASTRRGDIHCSPPMY